ncbi:MAG: hypothetical protein AAFW82_08715, partial [Pseudomonadota bacterium]
PSETGRSLFLHPAAFVEATPDEDNAARRENFPRPRGPSQRNVAKSAWPSLRSTDDKRQSRILVFAILALA